MSVLLKIIFQATVRKLQVDTEGLLEIIKAISVNYIERDGDNSYLCRPEQFALELNRFQSLVFQIWLYIVKDI